MTQPPSPLINDNDYNNLPAFDLWDILDIVKTQGAYLKSCPPTPIHHNVDNDEFATKLYNKLDFFVLLLEIRRRKYGDAADEWPPGYTPTEIKEKHEAEVERLFAMMEAPFPHTSTFATMTQPPPPPIDDNVLIDNNDLINDNNLIDDNDYNDLPAFDLWDILDVVKTQGAYLKSCPPTPPILCHVNDDEFATKLCRRLEFFVHMLEIRRRRYGDVADEWPPGYTPTEIKEKRKAEVERLFAMMEAPSPPTPSPSNSEGSPNSAPSCHQSRLPASECAAPEPRQGKKRRREDAGEESKRKKSRRVAAKTNRQLQQVPSPDDTAAEPVPST